MISSSHALMQNEGSYITEFSIYRKLHKMSEHEFKKFFKIFIESDIGKHLQCVVSQTRRKRQAQLNTCI